MACSSDGSQLLIGSSLGIYIYDGSAFTIQTNGISSTVSFNCVAANSTMSILMACSSSYLYISINSGTSWTQLNTIPLPSGTAYWTSVACDSTGNYMIASVLNSYIYTSSNAGTSWTQQTSLGTKSWLSVGLSSDGTQAVVAGSGDSVYTYLFSTNQWTQQISLPTTANWSAVCINGNGTSVSAGLNTGGVWTFVPINL
jgi:hypothetical protein